MFPAILGATYSQDIVVGADLVMAFHRELSIHNTPYKVLDLLSALEKVYNMSSILLLVTCNWCVCPQCCEVQHKLLTTFEKQTRFAQFVCRVYIYIPIRFSVDQLQSELCLEMATWQLLHILEEDRSEEEGRESLEVLLTVGDGDGDKTLTDRLFARDSCVRQAQASLPCERSHC